MGPNILYRWGGLVAMVGGIVGAVGEVGFLVFISNRPVSTIVVTPQWEVLVLLQLMVVFLAMLGLFAFYARQAQQVGSLGLIAFIIAVFATMMDFGLVWTAAFIFPALAETASDFLDTIRTGPSAFVGAGFMLTLLLFGLGWFLFGLASLRAKVFPRTSAWLIMLGALLVSALGILEIPLSALVLSVGLAWMGQWLRSDSAKVEESSTDPAKIYPDDKVKEVLYEN